MRSDEQKRDRVASETPGSPLGLQNGAEQENLPQLFRILDAIGSAIWMLDDQSRILYFNKAAERLFHRSVAEITGRPCWEIVHDSMQILDCPTVRARASGNREKTELEFGERWLEVAVDVARDAAGRALGYIHIATDITARKQAEHRIKEQEEVYRIVSDFAFDWEYWVSPDGNLAYISPSCERITGYSASEFLKNPGLIERIVHPEDRERYWHHVAELAGEDHPTCQNLEFRVFTKAGEILWLEHNCQPVFSPDGAYVGQRAANRDISCRKRIETELQTSEQRLKALLEASTESAFLMTTNGTLLVANRTTVERLNIDQEKLHLEAVYDIFPPEVADNRKRHVLKAIETKQPVRFEDERFGRIMQNSICPILDGDGQVTDLAGFGVDVTEERRSRQLLEENQRKLAEINATLEQVINTIPVRLFWKDRHSKYLGCNKLLAMDAGRKDPADLIGDDDFNMPWKDLAERYQSDDEEVMTTGVAKLNYEEPLDTPTGQRVWLRTTKVPVRDQAGNITGLLGTYEDITETKILENRIQESEERYRNLFTNCYAPMLLIDPESGQIMDANGAACSYYGHDRTRLIGMLITEINLDLPDQIFEEMARAKAERRNHFYFWHRLASGEIRPVEVYSGPITLNGSNYLYSIIHDISERRKAEDEKERLILELRDALGRIKTLSGLLPICASCKKIRDDHGYWTQIESYIEERSDAEFTHGICPECKEKFLAGL